MDLSTRQGRREQGLRIQRAVERAGLSIEELAGRIGCSRALIYQYLSGTTLAQPDRLQQIAAIVSVPLAYFYTEEDDPEPAVPSSAPVPPPQEVTNRLADSLRALQDLVEAQENPPDYRAVAATCERILSLAAQLGDRIALARAQKRLGNACLRMADYPRAADALTRAVALTQEAGDIAGEAAARQSLGNALLAMGRIAEAREQFTRIAGGPVFEGRWQGTLSLGCIHEMQGEYQQAMARFDEAAALLEEAAASGVALPQDISIGLIYVNTNRRNVYMDGGDFRAARLLAEKGLADAESLGNADQHLEARFDLAWCDFYTGRWQQAYRGFSTMLQLARFIGDQGRETMARAWLGILLAAAGDYETAIAQGKDALAQALSRGDRRAELYAQLALADAYLTAPHRDSEARYHTNQALAVTLGLRYERGEIECRLRLARVHRQAGEWEEARETVQRALVLAQRLGARHLESLTLLEHAETRFAQRADVTQGERNTSDEETRAAIGKAAQTALELAESLELIEARWRANDLLGRLALESQPPQNEEIEMYLRRTVELLEALRAELRNAGAPDTLLENADCLAVYARLARWLRQNERENAVGELLEQAGWPPLNRLIAPDANAGTL